MGKHFVPQHYLQGFTQGGQLWAYDKKNKKSFLTQPKSVANESRIYSEELENHFTRRVEQPANDVIDKIRAGQDLSSDDRDILTHYMYALWKRVPSGRERTLEKIPEVASEVESKLHKDFDKVALANPELQDQVSKSKRLVSHLVKNNTGKHGRDFWQQTLFSEPSRRVINALTSMNWQFLAADAQSYLTSDNPLFFFAHEGIGPEKAEVTIPFSSNIALWMNRDPRPKALYARAHPAFVKEVNRRTVQNALRFVYSAVNEGWMEDFIFKGHCRLNRVAW